jgi:hypothetical protein
MLNTTKSNIYIYINGGVFEMRLSQGISCPPTFKKNGTVLAVGTPMTMV